MQRYLTDDVLWNNFKAMNNILPLKKKKVESKVMGINFVHSSSERK